MADAYDGRCRSYNELGRYQQAADNCKAAIKAKATHAYAYNNLATALDALDDTEGAITAYSKSIAIKPEFVYSYLGRANIFIKLGDKERARKDLDKALTIDPVNTAAREAIASLQIDTPGLNDARLFLEDVQAFVSEQNPAPPSIAQIATAAAALQIAITKFDERETAEPKFRLNELLNSILGFQEFLRNRKDERDRLYAQRLIGNGLQAGKNLFFIDNYVKKNLLDAKTAPLFRLREQINVALMNRNNDDLDKANAAFKAFVQSSQLSQEYENVVASYIKPAALPFQPAPNLTLTDKTEIAIGGLKTDLVLIFNATASAPSIVKTLEGKFIFLTGNPSMCVAQAHIDEDRLWFIERKIFRDGASGVRDELQPCDLSHVRTTTDIIAFQRSELLKQDTVYITALLDLLQTDAFRRYDVVSEAAYNEILQSWEFLSRTIAFEVEHNQRKGFGVLVVTDKALPICAVSSDPIMKLGLESLLQRERATISRRLRFDLAIKNLPVEATFVALTKEQCGYVASDAKSLSKLLFALRRDGKTAEFAALWFSDDEVSRVGSIVLGKADEEKRAAEERNKMNEAARKHKKHRSRSFRTHFGSSMGRERSA